jgi:hypothetical protein
MPTPKIWNEFLDGHVLIISKSNDCEAYLRTQQRLKDRGFTNIVHISLPSVNTLNTNWNEIFNNKSYKFDKDDTAFIDTNNFPYKQQFAIAHLNAYKYIINNKLDFALIVEDNIVFHKDWDLLAPKYFEVTPTDYYLCYVGHHCGCGINAHVIRAPTFSMQSIIVTLEGAQYLLDKLLTHPKGIRTIDCMINYEMTQALVNQEPDTDGISDDFCNWYAWNAEMFPDDKAVKFYQFIDKDKGLIFQEDADRVNKNNETPITGPNNIVIT